MLPNNLVFYDLPPEQDNFLKNLIYKDSSEWNRVLAESNDEIVKEFLANEKSNSNIENNWKYSNGVLASKYGALLVQKGACVSTLKEYKSLDKRIIYELRGKYKKLKNITEN